MKDDIQSTMAWTLLGFQTAFAFGLSIQSFEGPQLGTKLIRIYSPFVMRAPSIHYRSVQESEAHRGRNPGLKLEITHSSFSVVQG